MLVAAAVVETEVEIGAVKGLAKCCGIGLVVQARCSLVGQTSEERTMAGVFIIVHGGETRGGKRRFGVVEDTSTRTREIGLPCGLRCAGMGEVGRVHYSMRCVDVGALFVLTVDLERSCDS